MCHSVALVVGPSPLLTPPNWVSSSRSSRSFQQVSRAILSCGCMMRIASCQSPTGSLGLHTARGSNFIFSVPQIRQIKRGFNGCGRDWFVTVTLGLCGYCPLSEVHLISITQRLDEIIRTPQSWLECLRVQVSVRIPPILIGVWVRFLSRSMKILGQYQIMPRQLMFTSYQYRSTLCNLRRWNRSWRSHKLHTRVYKSSLRVLVLPYRYHLHNLIWTVTLSLPGPDVEHVLV
jgi:hypothetical protein